MREIDASVIRRRIALEGPLLAPFRLRGRVRLRLCRVRLRLCRVRLRLCRVRLRLCRVRLRLRLCPLRLRLCRDRLNPLEEGQCLVPDTLHRLGLLRDVNSPRGMRGDAELFLYLRSEGIIEDPLGITPLARLVAGSSFDANEDDSKRYTPSTSALASQCVLTILLRDQADDGANEFVALLETNADS